MKYKVKYEQIMDVMKDYMQRNIEPIQLPLTRRRVSSEGNSGYDSGLHDYTFHNTYYSDQNGTTLFSEYDSRYMWSDSNWAVSEVLVPLYNFFGEELFEEFVKWYFEFDITKKYDDGRMNWVFGAY